MPYDYSVFCRDVQKLVRSLRRGDDATQIVSIAYDIIQRINEERYRGAMNVCVHGVSMSFITEKKRQQVSAVEVILDDLLDDPDLTKGDQNKIAAQLGLLVPNNDAAKPRWDKDLGELIYRGEVIRQITVSKASNITTVLDVFEELGWPNGIDDPLPGKKLKDEASRRHDTVKSLNKGLSGVTFHVVGEKITWCEDPPSSP